MDILLLSKYCDTYPRFIALTVQKWVLNRYFHPTKTKLFIFTRYQSSKIGIILRQNLNLVRVLLYIYVHANFQGEESFMYNFKNEKLCSFVDLLCFCSVLCLLCFVHVCLYVPCGHLLGKG